MNKKRALNQSRFSNRRFQIVVAIIALLIFLLTSLPHAIRYGSTRWILANGGEEVHIADVDFNPFTGRLIFEEVQVLVNETSVLEAGRVAVKFAWFPLFQHRAHIRDISFNQTSVTIERTGSGDLLIAGVALPDSRAKGAAEIPWLIGIDQVILAGCEIRFSDKELKTSAIINNLTLGNLSQWTPGKGAALHLEGSLNGSALKIDGLITPFAEEPQFSGKVNLSGLQMERFVNFAKPTFSALKGNLTINSEIKVRKNKERRLIIMQKGTVSLAGSQIATRSWRSLFGNLTWKGSSSIKAASDNGAFFSRTDGMLSLSGFEVNFPERDLFIESDSVMWNGKITLDSFEDMTDVTMAGAFWMQATQARAEERKINLLSLERLDANSISVESADSLSIAGIVIKGLIIANENGAEGDEPASGSLTRAGEMTISNIRFHGDSGLSVDSISEKDLRMVVSRDRDGQWNAVRFINLLARLTEDEAEAGRTSTEKQDSQETGESRDSAENRSLRVGKILITGNSSITFTDKTAQPPFSTMINIVSAQIRDIDNARPDNASHISLEGLVGKHAKAQISGTVRPFAAPVAYTLEGNVEGYELPSLSSYTMNQMGFEVSSGQLEAEFIVTVDKGLLDGKTDMTIRQFKIGTEDKAKLGVMEKSLAVPLNVALRMLQDKNKTIHLEVPFTGEPNSPDFDFSDAINQALTSAMKKGALTYLTLALQPYGSLIMVAKYAGEAATNVQLNPVIFTPASSVLEPESVDYLNKIAYVLRDRPGLSIRICGVAVKADLNALTPKATEDPKGGTPTLVENGETAIKESIPVSDEQLYSLAEERADETKDYLVTELGIESVRLIACKPSLDMSREDADPRVDLII